MLARSLLVVGALLLAAVPTLASDAPRVASLNCTVPWLAVEPDRPTTRAADSDAEIGSDRAACVVWLSREGASDQSSWRDYAHRYQSDVDCDDMEYQEDAQRILERYPDDPYNLDPSGDGVACSLLPTKDRLSPAGDGRPSRARPERRDQAERARPGTTQRTRRPDGLRADLSLAVRDVGGFWKASARRSGWRYSAPTVRLLKHQPLDTECGRLESGGGPAYCPFDRTIYIDLPLMRAVEPFRDPFLMRVIIAHEWAHHVQRLTGYQEAAFPDSSGEVFSLQMELHADCLAGVWAQAAVDAGDATDDDLRRAVTLAFLSGDLPGSPLRGPDAHGSGEMRAGAFLYGIEGGTVASCEDALLQPR